MSKTSNQYRCEYMSKINYFLKNSLLLFILLLSNFTFCQENQTKEIDQLLQKAEDSRRRFKNLDQLQYAKQASIIAEKEGNPEKIAECYYNIARALSFLELQKESFNYVNKTFQQPYTRKNAVIQAQLKEVKAFNYYSLGMPSQFDKELPGIIKLLEKETGKDAIILRQRTYLNMGASKPDSAQYYARLCFRELKKLPEKDTHLELSDYYRFLGTNFLDKKSDSALYYFKKSWQINQKYKDPILFFDYTAFGDYYAQQKQYNQAITYYEKAIQNIKEQSITPYHFVNNELYKKISDLYGELGEKSKQEEYKNKYLACKKNY